MITAMFFMMEICIRTRNKASRAVYSSGSRSEVGTGRTKTFIGKTYTLIPHHVSFDSVLDSDPSSTSSSNVSTVVTALTAGATTSCSYTADSTLDLCFKMQSRSAKQTDSNSVDEDADDVLPDLEVDDDHGGMFVTQAKQSLSSKTHPNSPFTASSSRRESPPDSLLKSPLMLSPTKSLIHGSVKDTHAAKVFLGCSSLLYIVLSLSLHDTLLRCCTTFTWILYFLCVTSSLHDQVHYDVLQLNHFILD